MKQGIKKINKKKVLMVLAVVITIIIVVLLVIFFAKKDQSKSLEGTLKDLGKDFYENYYYEQTGKTLEEKKTFLSRFNTLGIKINLDNLSRYNSNDNKDKIESFKNNETKKECNKENTKVIIYPKEGYGKTDYEIKVELDCGFDTK